MDAKRNGGAGAVRREPALPWSTDSDRVAAILKAIASPVRIDLLKALRVPRTLGEIRLTPRRRDARAEPGAMNRVVVRKHLDRLLEIGAVQRRRIVRDGRAMDHYLVNHRQVFGLVEDLRLLALLRADDQALDGTQLAPPPPEPEAGPRLTLVNGVYEGRRYPLHAMAGSSRWAIGRRETAGVCLDYDPYVSLEHAEIRLGSGGYAVTDLPRSRNGTTLNGRLLAKGEPHRLSSGDVVGVGRSALVFRLE